jgi:hydroxymethylglutaryl-CoA lyase
MKEMKLPKSVTIGECLMRDGLQNLDFFVPTDAKVWLLDELTECGFKYIETTSFAHPKYLPQFRDCEEVLKRIKKREGVRYQAVAVGEKAHERMVEASKSGLIDKPPYGVWLGVSETHARSNTGRTHEELWKFAEFTSELAKKDNTTFGASLATAFGCPLAGPQSPDKVIEFIGRFSDLGATFIQIADTTGEATPKLSYEIFNAAIKNFPHIQFASHFHECRGWALANCWAALEAGCTWFDSSIGGLGGQPTNFIDRTPVGGTGKRYTASDLTGNVRTEDLVIMLDECGIDTGLDIDRVLEVGRMVEKICGKRLKSWTLESGRIPKKPVDMYYELNKKWGLTPDK